MLYCNRLVYVHKVQEDDTFSYTDFPQHSVSVHKNAQKTQENTMKDLPVPPYCTIAGKELITQVSTSSGPGGQHVNKTSTKVTLRWNLARSTSLTDRQRAYLTSKLGKKLNKNNEVVVHCDSTRSQHMNHIKVREKLVKLLETAFFKPKKRIKTRPTKGSVERRIKQKKRRSEIKKGRSFRNE